MKEVYTPSYNYRHSISNIGHLVWFDTCITVSRSKYLNMKSNSQQQKRVHCFSSIKFLLIGFCLFITLFLFEYITDSPVNFLKPKPSYPQIKARRNKKAKPVKVKSQKSDTQKTPPNIVIIVADDMGWNDISWHNSLVKSPKLEKLAKDGILLEQHYAQHVCTPSRGALLTGL